MNMLGWMGAPEESLAQWDDFVALAAAVRADGLTRTLVCGMGGSSLVADVLAQTFGARDLHVLDSTNPDAVRAAGSPADISRTLFVISSKSGNTVETLAFCHYFLGFARPEQFIAITEMGSPLDQLARARGFRAVIPHPPDVGGRYSALTAVGMVPAALSGLDGRALLERTRRVDVGAAEAMGTAIAERAQAGRDKLYVTPPPRIAALASWIEQLIAESSGKNGRGVIPVVQERDGGSPPLADSQTVGPDMFSTDPLDLGVEFLRWEYAIRALCERLGANAFDQPDVEEAKRLARAELTGGDSRGVGTQHAAPLLTLPLAPSRAPCRPRDYFALLLYVPPTPP